MTLVIGIVGQDGVVLSSDGKVTSGIDGSTIQTDAQKVFEIDNSIFWGFAAHYMATGEPIKLAKHIKRYMNFSTGYTMQDVADSFSYMVSRMHIGRPDGFWINFILAGYDSLGGSVWRIDSKNNYKPERGSHISIGNWSGGVLDLGKPSQTSEEIAKMNEKIIRREEKTVKLVGGDIRTVIIEGMGKKKFKELIKKASTLVPKDQDKQLHPEGYNEKQTRSHKTASTSAKCSDNSNQ